MKASLALLVAVATVNSGAVPVIVPAVGMDAAVAKRADAPVTGPVSFHFNPATWTVVAHNLNAKQPGIPTKSTAQTELASLTVKAFVDPGGYNRELFPHWSTQSGTCNIRYFLRNKSRNLPQKPR